jgi:hypothetical protein
MFGAQSFYHGITKKMVVVFGSIFSSVVITRTNASSGDQNAVIKVPIQYAAKEKMLSRVNNDPSLDRPTSILLPRMSFEITDIRPRRQDHLPTMNRPVKDFGDPNKLKYQYVPVPFDIKFSLYVYVKNAEDGTKIVEQIYPFFTPDWTASVEMIPDMNETKDIPFILDNVSIQDTFDGDFKVRRVLVYQLDFTCKTYFYGPIKTKPIIKFFEADIHMGQLGEAKFETIKLQPGLTANGQPTTHSSDSKPAIEINITDDYGFAFDTIKD